MFCSVSRSALGSWSVDGLLLTRDLFYLSRPILTPRTVLPLFFAVGIIFAPIGGLLLWASAQVSAPMGDYHGNQGEKPV